jgi:glycerol-3-phosphate O-acyltransferase/dihydroxyacetone phosphate acyltransferase
MRPFYFVLYFIINYALRIVFRSVKTKDAPTQRRNISIIVSNHPSAFMDPLVIACFQKPIVFFMTRSDVFKPAVAPILASANMLPIYRQMDGEGAVQNNKSVFLECYKLLKTKRSPLLFGEGLTDDIFERRLKPIKTGAARMAFGAMEFHQWKIDLYIHCMGLNYENPTRLRGNLLIANAPLIPVKNYHSLFLKNEEKAVNQLTKDIEAAIKSQITHIEDIDYLEMHEQIMRITYKGMHFSDHDNSIPIHERQSYSKQLADRINTLASAPNANFLDLKNALSNYFIQLETLQICQAHVHEKATTGKLDILKPFLFLIFMWPIALIGLLLMGLPYWITKRLVEQKFKRKVFWLSTKMVVGLFIAGIYNIFTAILVYQIIISNIWVTLLFYFTIPAATFLIAYEFKTCWLELIKKLKTGKLNLTELINRRADLLNQIRFIFEK